MSFNTSKYTDTLIEKLVRFQNQSALENITLKISFQYIPATREINFSKALCQIKAIQLEHTQIFYWNYDKKIFVYIGIFPFREECYLKYENFQQNLIHIKFRRIPVVNNASHSGITKAVQQDNQKMEIQNRQNKPQAQKRVKERSILEVIQLVSRWRELYEKTDLNNKKIHTLDTAAREVGISKKTLDDYFLQLKLGQAYGFNFQDHQQSKIGALRSFVRKNHKGNSRKESQPLKMLAKYLPQNTCTDSSAMVEQSVAPSSDEQDTQNYLFHQDHSFESDC